MSLRPITLLAVVDGRFDGWRIVSIADTYRTSGCPARPAPER